MSALWHLEPIVLRLAVELLDEEVHLAAYGRGALGHAAQLGDVAAQPHGLLVDGDRVGEDGALGEHARVVHGQALQGLAQLLLQPGAVLRDGLGRALLDYRR